MIYAQLSNGTVVSVFTAPQDATTFPGIVEMDPADPAVVAFLNPVKTAAQLTAIDAAVAALPDPA